MSEPCAHERDVPYVPAALVADLERVIAGQLAELYTLRDKVARVERFAADMGWQAMSAVRPRSGIYYDVSADLRRALEGP